MKDLVLSCPGFDAVIDEAARIAALLWDKGWAERNAGNLSIDVTDLVAGAGCAPLGPAVPLGTVCAPLAGRYFLVTGTLRRFRDAARRPADNLCVLRLTDGCRGYEVVWGGGDDPAFRPTSEFPAHLRVHDLLATAKKPRPAVLHTHPTELIALTHLADYRDEAAFNRVLWAVHPEVKVTVPHGVGLVPYILPGTDDLARATVGALGRGHHVALWSMHGCVATGETVTQAFDLIDTLNKAAQIALMVRAAGGEVAGLTGAQVDELMRVYGPKD